jgi:hypothetical protein
MNEGYVRVNYQEITDEIDNMDDGYPCYEIHKKVKRPYKKNEEIRRKKVVTEELIRAIGEMASFGISKKRIAEKLKFHLSYFVLYPKLNGAYVTGCEVACDPIRKKSYDMALKGDQWAMKFWLDQSGDAASKEAQHKEVFLGKSSGTFTEKSEYIMSLIYDSTITAAHGKVLMEVLEKQAKIFAASELDDRLKKIEDALSIK